MEFLIRGATTYKEPGVFMAFEETEGELAQNVRSLRFDLDQMIKEKKVAVDYVRIERDQIDETGDYDLEGLFIRIGAAIDASKPSAWCSTRSRTFSPDFRIRAFCALSCGGCFAGSKTGV